MEKSLAGKVALVAGATRGTGRGIAVQLGAAGACIYVTGRTTRSERSEMNRPETNYRVSFFYDLAKACVNRMAFALAHEVAALWYDSRIAHARLAAIRGHA